MGPIERELRSCKTADDVVWRKTSIAAYMVACDAAKSLTGAMHSLLDSEPTGLFPDIMSEAIEAAEALGL